MSLAETLAPIWAELSSIKKRLPSVSPATVTSVDPVRIQVDGQTAPVAASPDTLVPVGPGDRVRVLRYGTTHLILGRVNTAGQPWRMAAGTAVVPFNGDWNDITFPAGRFTVTPNGTATIADGVGASLGATVRFLPDSPTSGRLHVSKPGTTGDVSVHWHAIQMTPTSAEG